MASNNGTYGVVILTTEGMIVVIKTIKDALTVFLGNSRDADSAVLMKLHDAQQAKIDGLPTYQIADSQKNCLESMLACCNAEESSYWKQPEGRRLSAAPFYFERAAILLRKQKDYAAEIKVCEKWKSIITDYKNQPVVKKGESAKVHLGPRSKAILERLKKAKELNKKSTTK